MQDIGYIPCVSRISTQQIWTDPVFPILLTSFRFKQVHRGLGHPDHRGGDGG